MPYDRYQTPEMARRQRAYERMCVLALVMMLATIVAAAAIVVVVVGA